MKNWISAAALAAAILLSGCSAAESTPPEPVSVDSLSAVVTIAGQEYTGSYSGWTLENLPHGDGRFESAGVLVTGTFEEGTVMQGDAENLPMDMEWEGVLYIGHYTGALRNGRPHGQGQFRATSELGLSLELESGWVGGVPKGDGYAQADHFAPVYSGTARPGSYTGQTLHGQPHGEGTFRSRDELGEFTYTGQWRFGLFHGQGELTYESEHIYPRHGEFTNGYYTPTYVQAVEALGAHEPTFTLTDAQREFILSHPGLWEANADRFDYSHSEFRTITARNFYSKQLFTNPEKFETSWVRMESLRFIDSKTIHISEDLTFTRITASESTYTMTFQLYLLGELPQTPGYLNRIHVFAMPVGLSTYTNTLGDDVPCAVLLVGDIRI